MAFKKMIHDQAKLTGHQYLLHRLWLSNGREMVQVHMYNTKVIVDNKQLSLEEVQALNDRKNDFWVGGWKIVKLF